MNDKKMLYRRLIGMGLLILALTQGSWANLVNISSATYSDSNNTTYPAVSSNLVTVTVTAAPGITLTKSASASSVTSGQAVTFTIAYTNTGGAATNVVITDTIPTGSTLVGGTISNGGTANGNVITWTIGNLATNASGTVSFQVKAN